MSRRTRAPAPPLLDDTLVLAADTLTGDLRDLILDTLRHEQDKRPWSERSEEAQRETVARVESAVHDWVTQAVTLIAADGRQVMKGTLAQVVVKDGIKAIVYLSKSDPQRHALIDAQGARVLLVVADPDDYDGEREGVPISADQPHLAGAEF